MRRRGQNGHRNTTIPHPCQEEEHLFTCKWLKFVLQVKLLLPNGAQIHLEIWADCIFLNFLADLENFIRDGFRSRTCKMKRARGKMLKNPTARGVNFRNTAKTWAGNTLLGEEHQEMRGAEHRLLHLGKPLLGALIPGI